MKIIDRAKSILSYWDRALCILVFAYALKHQMEAVAITFALLTIIGGKRVRGFIISLLDKIEKSNKGAIGGYCEKRNKRIQIN